MDNVNESPKKNNPCPPNDAGEEEKKMHVFNVLDRFVRTYILEPTDDEGDDVVGDNDDNYDGKDGVFNYAAEEVGQLSRDIFRPMILRYFLSASKRPVD